MIEAITDHVTRALARLKTVFRGSAEMQGLISALAFQVQAFEDACNDTREVIRSPDLCVTRSKDATLTRIAKLVGARAQGGLNQSDYRDLILGQIQTNVSQGDPESLMRIWTAMLDSHLGPLYRVVDAEPGPGDLGLLGGPGVILLTGDLSVGLFVSEELIRSAMDQFHSAVPIGSRCLVAAAVDPTNYTSGIFYLDSTNTDGDERMICVFDSPSTVR